MYKNNKITKVIKRSGVVVPFAQERILNAIYKSAIATGGRNKKTAEKLSDEVAGILNKCFYPDNLPNVEDIQDITEKVLIENGHSKTAKAFILYRYDRIKERLEKGKRTVVPFDKVPYHKIYHILNWAIDNNVERISKVNEIIKQDKFSRLIEISENKYQEEIETAAKMMLEMEDNLKVVIVAGPSSSGKTTTTIKISEILQKNKKNFVTLNVDNYFYDLKLHPKDEHGDYDFETPEALDLDLINKHIHQLIAGKKVEVPLYNFKTGIREKKTLSLKLNPGEIVLIDSLHGLHKKMTGSIDNSNKFNLYIETLLQMKDKNNEFVRWTDLRLLRRMVRDSKYRSYNPQMTIEHWHYVRSSELRHIIPFVNTANYIINSAMPYELPVMKNLLLHNFEGFINTLKNNVTKQDAYLRTIRVKQLLESFESIGNFSCIPSDALIREFIGGSRYKY